MSQRIARSVALIATAAASVARRRSPPAAPREPVAAPGVTDDTVTIGTHTAAHRPRRGGLLVDLGGDEGVLRLRQRQRRHQRPHASSTSSRTTATTRPPPQTVVRELVQEDEVFAILNGLGTPDAHRGARLPQPERGARPVRRVGHPRAGTSPSKYPYTFGVQRRLHHRGRGARAVRRRRVRRTRRSACSARTTTSAPTSPRASRTCSAPTGSPRRRRYSVSNQDVVAQIGAMQAAGCEVNILATVNGFTALAHRHGRQDRLVHAQWVSSSSGGDYPTLVGYLGEDVAPLLLQGFVSSNYLPFSAGRRVGRAVPADQRRVQRRRPVQRQHRLRDVGGLPVRRRRWPRPATNPTRESLARRRSRSGDLPGNGIVPLSFAKDSHAAYEGVGITRRSTRACRTTSTATIYTTDAGNGAGRALHGRGRGARGRRHPDRLTPRHDERPGPPRGDRASGLSGVRSGAVENCADELALEHLAAAARAGARRRGARRAGTCTPRCAPA